GTPIQLNAWHHIALTFDGGTLSMYIDGLPVATASTTLNTDGNYPLVIGSNTPTRSDEYFEGSVYSLTMWDRALSASEILDDYNAIPIGGQRAHWFLGNNSTDSIGGTTDYTLEGAVGDAICPELDQDEDGVAAFEDCDDTNPTITYDCPCDSSGIGTYADFEIGASCPVAYWDMETTTGSGEIADLIGTVDLAINGSPTPGVSGVQGSTYAINACSDFFLSSSGYPSVLQGDTPKSISAWGHLGAKGGDGDGQAPLVSFGGGCGGTAFAVTYSTESLSGDAPMLGTCGNDLRPSATPWSLSQWYHIVGTYDGTELKLYVDGALVGTKSTTISTNTGHNHVGIGVDTWWNGTYHWLCNGKVDEVKLYSYELSSTEVSELYNLDADGDGVAAFEDCDDTDNMVSDTASGYSALCAAASCKTILAAGHSRGDDTYWLDPDGLGAFEVYCDMTTDGGGWTHIQSINSVNATQYDSTNILENRSTFGGLNDDNALSHAFYRVEFSESYLIDEANTTPVFSDTPFTNGTVNALLDSMQGSNYSSTPLWSIGSRTFLNVRNSSTSDGIFFNGDLRIDILLNEQDTTNIAHPVTSNYNANQNGYLESALVLDSDFGYAGGRIYGDPLYNISSVGVDNRMQLFVR
ncbi:MAG: LamG-like jellyroll fold domain-containing protein, partial [Myxococcota bacterium]|nr:LamG-like jellyroll fold domain-containing protein [Myxococcota bacterium]